MNSANSPIECFISLRLVRNGEVFSNAFGPGIAQLVRKVGELGSLNCAAKSMGMAYSKAWRIVRDVEAQFGFELMIRDGARGSTLTENGVKLLTLYDKVQKAADDAAQAVIAQSDICF